MRYLEAPGDLKDMQRPAVFLAGGITGCGDWQKDVAEVLRREVRKGTMLNPRRENFPMDDPNAARAQIMWEHGALWASDVVSFWFAGSESVQPIVMFEYGCHLGRYCIGGGPTRIVVGVDPDYKRKQDVLIQTEAHNLSLQGSWKIHPILSFKDYVTSLVRVLNSMQ